MIRTVGQSFRAASDRVEDAPPAPMSSGTTLLVVVCGAGLAALYLAYLNPVLDFRWDQKNDSIFYLALTRRLVEEGIYASRRWPPGLSVMVAPVFWAVGPDMVWLKAAMAVLGIGAWSLVFVWVRRVTGDGLLAAACALAVGTSWLFFDFSHRFLAEVPFAFWLMAFLCLAESRAAGWRANASLAALLLAGTMVQLTRGNGIVLVPAIVAALVATRGVERVIPAAVRLTPRGRALALVALALPLVAWHVRSSLVTFDGFHGGTQVDFVLASHSTDDVPTAVQRIEPGGRRASVSTLARRAYRTAAWGHVFYLPVAACYPLLAGLIAIQFKTWLGLLIVLPAWMALTAGAVWMLRWRPLACWLLAFTVGTLLVLPWPDGTHVRYLVPAVPLLTATAGIGLVQLAGRRAGLAVLALVCGANLWITWDRVQFRAEHPYFEPEFGNLVALLPSAPGTLRPGDRIVVDDSVSGVAYALTGAAELPIAAALAAIDDGRAPDALFAASPSTPVLMKEIQQRLDSRPELGIETVAVKGESRLFRVVGRRGGAE